MKASSLSFKKEKMIMTNKKEEILHKKLQQISSVLQEKHQDNPHVGVLAGISGMALFHYYYYGLTREESSADLGAGILAEVVEKINEGYNFPTFCTGIAGAAWAIELLCEEHFIDINTDGLLAELDDFLLESMTIEAKENHHDFLHGALGMGYYFLKRYQNTKSTPLKEKYKAILTGLITSLKETSKHNEKGIFWESELHKKECLIGVNLSMSHGMASIINFLCRLYVYPDFKPLVGEMIIASISYVLSFRNKDHSIPALLPSWVSDTIKEKEHSRLAWCYGDLGMGITLWRAGKALDNVQYKEEAITLLKHSAKRRDLNEAKVFDAGLCHGAFGIMTICNYMYKETLDPVFKETTEFWMGQALDMAIHEDGYAGYLLWRGDIKEWNKEINLLEGIAGIGLAIISYLAPHDSKWNECLMIG